MEKSATKIIGINTIYLFVRKLVTLIIAFYTSRLLLERLGIDDFGLYGLIGSIVLMFNSLRGLFSTSIQRFISIAKGVNDYEKVNRIFSIGLKIHVWIAIGFVAIVEVGGLIILPTLNIPSGSYNATMWILQFSIFTAAVTILTIPYDALIIANEKFKIYSILSIIEHVLKLLIVVALALCYNNRVIYYAGMLFAVSILIRFVNSLYCRIAFGSESKYNNFKDSHLLKEMTSFAGWQFCGNTGFTLANSGINIILNLFGGVVVNAARTVAYQVNSAVSGLLSDINVSFQPRTMMLYSSKDLKGFWQLFYINSKATFSLSIMIAFPIILCAQSMLKIWLGEVPQYSVVFLQYIMIYVILRSLHGSIDLLFKSEGKLKWYQLTELFIMILNLPISWIALKFGAPFWSVFAIMCFVETLNLFVILILAKVQVGLSIRTYNNKIVIRCLIVCLILLGIYFIKTNYVVVSNDILSFLLISGFSFPISGFLLYLILFSSEEKRKILKMLHLL